MLLEGPKLASALLVILGDHGGHDPEDLALLDFVATSEKRRRRRGDLSARRAFQSRLVPASHRNAPVSGALVRSVRRSARKAGGCGRRKCRRWITGGAPRFFAADRASSSSLLCDRSQAMAEAGEHSTRESTSVRTPPRQERSGPKRMRALPGGADPTRSPACSALRGSHARAVARRRARAARRLLPRVPHRPRGEHARRRKRDPGARSQASTTGLATPQRDGSAPREYVTDGKHRRVGKKVDGVLVKQWLYRDQLNPVAELDGAGDLVAQFVYGSRGHVPDFMVRGGVVYRIVSDQIGSVRLVVNADDVSDVLFRAEYTAFGEMTVLE